MKLPQTSVLIGISEFIHVACITEVNMQTYANHKDCHIHRRFKCAIHTSRLLAVLVMLATWANHEI